MPDRVELLVPRLVIDLAVNAAMRAAHAQLRAGARYERSERLTSEGLVVVWQEIPAPRKKRGPALAVARGVAKAG